MFTLFVTEYFLIWLQPIDKILTNIRDTIGKIWRDKLYVETLVFYLLHDFINIDVGLLFYYYISVCVIY